MGQPKPSIQPKERRVNNLHEAVLGFAKKQNLEESRRCPQCAVATCMPGCPLGVDIPGFIRLLREDDTLGALECIRRENPFPAICGRICPAPCESACIFNEEGSPVAVRALERYASDFGRPKSQKIKLKLPVSKSKKIAIIGSGPSGMSAAYYLAREGYGVTVFEAADALGGILRYGIPEFRLPEKILDEQFSDLASLGVKFQTNAFVGSTITVTEIFSKGYAGILLAVGAGVPDFADIAGHNAGGVYYAEEFLMRAQLSSKAQACDGGSVMVHGLRSVVVGSGSSAIDAARLAIRFGQKVELVFGGLEEELGVRADEINMALEEGVVIHTPVEPLRIKVGPDGFAQGVICRRLELVEKDKKFTLESSNDEEKLIEAQTVILSHGRKPNTFLSKALPQLKWNSDGTIWRDVQTSMTSVDKVFAAGEVATGAGDVVNAIASGKKAAALILGYLNK